ncbi:MAG: hypothetical protein ACRBN8_38880 [Nannocystales bacterium]
MTPLKKILGTPLIHAVLGFMFLAAFSWPIFSFEEPINTWKFMYGAWAVGIGLLFLTTTFGSAPEADEMDDDEDVDVEGVGQNV